MRLNVNVDDKYAVIMEDDGKLRATRHGEPWRDCIGDNLVLAMAQQIETFQTTQKHNKETLMHLEGQLESSKDRVIRAENAAKTLSEWHRNDLIIKVRSREFYDLMQAYRISPTTDQVGTSEKFQEIWKFLLG